MSRRFPDHDDLCDYCRCARREHTGLDVDDGEILSETCCTHPDHDCTEFEFDLGITKKMIDAAIDAGRQAIENIDDIDFSRDGWFDIVVAVLQVRREIQEAEKPHPADVMTQIWEGTITGRITLSGLPPWHSASRHTSQTEGD